MSSVGPQLPRHLAKRKRSTNEDEGAHSPPRKVQAATASPPRTVGPTMPPTTNPDELDVGESSEDDHGPSIPTKPASNAPTKRVLGRSLPPSKNPEELSLEDSSEDEYGPSVPTTQSIATKELVSPPKRILGPSAPPASLSSRPSYPANDSSDSEDDYGPSLPPAPGSHAESLLHTAQSIERARSTAEAASSKPQRAEWMLAPPSDSDFSGRVDPTKLKNRKFASGKGAKAPSEKSGISAIWTETPAEKRQRLEDEVLGRKETASSGRGESSKKDKKSKELEAEERATARRIKEYNEKNRGRSLFEEREKMQERRGGKVEEEDDPSKRGFDREKDMALGGRLGNGQKKEMLAKAADFGSRFQKGSYL
ncbi:uncharacterized protein RAG0_07546 [Rhynchosporium agropyri]|uniref:DUF3752 domain-containing protein n=1 Tax=Rhynchosporium agropyri TaxID=914238 RepID=A0A1E1KLZ7_9HELO|nr:uncharacterized protein RAG0_07546 [Rhynchosporium agropyri]